MQSHIILAVARASFPVKPYYLITTNVDLFVISLFYLPIFFYPSYLSMKTEMKLRKNQSILVQLVKTSTALLYCNKQVHAIDWRVLFRFHGPCCTSKVAAWMIEPDEAQQFTKNFHENSSLFLMFYQLIRRDRVFLFSCKTARLWHCTLEFS